MKKYIKLPHILLMLVMFAGILFMPVCVSDYFRNSERGSGEKM